MRRNEEKVDVIEEKSITIKGRNGKNDTVIYLETDQVGLSRPIISESVYVNQRNSINLSGETYLERLHNNTIKELEEYDKKIVAEAFRNDDVLISRRTITLWQTIKYLFGMFDPHEKIKERFNKPSYISLNKINNPELTK